MEGEGTMQPTRWEILQLLKRRGRATVDELSRVLGMTLMGVRLHLVVLDRDGYVKRTTVREKPGRPALVYSLTPKAEEIFPKRYDLLAEKLLESLQESDGSSFMAPALEAAAHKIAAPLVDRVEGATLGQRVESVGHLLDRFGAFASWEKADGGFMIYHQNCLFYSVALRNRETCSIDCTLLRDMLGVEVEQRESLLEGAVRCSFFVPDVAATDSQDGASALRAES